MGRGVPGSVCGAVLWPWAFVLRAERRAERLHEKRRDQNCSCDYAPGCRCWWQSLPVEGGGVAIPALQGSPLERLGSGGRSRREAPLGKWRGWVQSGRVLALLRYQAEYSQLSAVVIPLPSCPYPEASRKSGRLTSFPTVSDWAFL